MTIQPAFPYTAHMLKVTDVMCDQNGHMNVAFYSQLFGQSFEHFYTHDMGFSANYFASGFSSFTLEDNVRYVHECLLDEQLLVHYRLHRVNKKLIHLVAIMLNEKQQLCAIYETVLGHIDMKIRKTTDMGEEFLDNLLCIMAKHTETALEFPLRLDIKTLR
ncbi:MAG TPA: hypothetical protein DCX08_04870 [Porticoccaceae bacterium]|jgi:acyl-CoA thioester hydrolase|nr:hypothetical protein [Porticoccaceae bacterium]